MAVLVGRQQRHVQRVEIVQLNAEKIARLRLYGTPGGHAANRHVINGAKYAITADAAILDQRTGCNRRAGAVCLIGAHENLDRRMGCVGLVLVDERRDGVDRVKDIVRRAENAVGARIDGRPRHHHEVGWTARNKQWIVRLQRYEYGTAATLVDEIETVIEKLAEERHPAVERRRQAEIGRDVGNLEHFDVIGGAEYTIQAGAHGDASTRRRVHRREIA